LEFSDYEEYVAEYARRYNLARHIKFNTTVKNLKAVSTSEGEQPGSSAWHLTWARDDGEEVTQQFQFVIVASGAFTVPNPLVLKGYRGVHLHASQSVEKNLEKDSEEQILIVGAGILSCYSVSL
jgi:cation diffusion facilitator CzcD-associated flavoprotein CzcO